LVHIPTYIIKRMKIILRKSACVVVLHYSPTNGFIVISVPYIWFRRSFANKYWVPRTISVREILIVHLKLLHYIYKYEHFAVQIFSDRWQLYHVRYVIATESIFVCGSRFRICGSTVSYYLLVNRLHVSYTHSQAVSTS